MLLYKCMQINNINTQTYYPMILILYSSHCHQCYKRYALFIYLFSNILIIDVSVLTVCLKVKFPS